MCPIRIIRATAKLWPGGVFFLTKQKRHEPRPYTISEYIEFGQVRPGKNISVYLGRTIFLTPPPPPRFLSLGRPRAPFLAVSSYICFTPVYPYPRKSINDTFSQCLPASTPQPYTEFMNQQYALLAARLYDTQPQSRAACMGFLKGGTSCVHAHDPPSAGTGGTAPRARPLDGSSCPHTHLSYMLRTRQAGVGVELS